MPESSEQTEKERTFELWQSVVTGSIDAEKMNAFTNFFHSWLMFNFLYQSCLGGERARAESFEAPEQFGRTHARLLSQDSRYRSAVEFFVRRDQPAPSWINPELQHKSVRVWNMDRQYKDSLAKQGVLRVDTDLKGLLGCLYVVRCNLFHGDKRPGDSLDIEILEAGHEVLNSLLKNYTFPK